MFNKLAITCFWVYIMPLGILSASAVIFFQNTLYLALNFIIILFISAIILFCLKAEFLAYIILLVYIGAILILFLFVIMMLNLKININPSLIVFSTWEFCIFFLMFLKGILIFKNMLIPTLINSFGNSLIWADHWNSLNFKFKKSFLINNGASTYQMESLGELLYNDFVYLFILIGIILLVAMVGTLIITTSKSLLSK